MFDPWAIIRTLTPSMRSSFILALRHEGVLQCGKSAQAVLMARNLADGVYDGEEAGVPDYTRCVGARLNERGSMVAHEILKVYAPEVDRLRLEKCWTPAMARNHARRDAEARLSA